MRTVSWESEALADLEEAFAFIAADSRQAALAIEGRILAAVDLLASRPIGRPSRMSNVWQKRVLKTPYIIAYHATETELKILRVVHQSRDWPDGGWSRR